MPERKDDRRRGQGGASDVAAAMNRVLTAEREAAEALESCRLEAERIQESGRRRAREILEHAERIAREVHARTERLAAARALQITSEAARREADPATDPLPAAVERLTRRMTGGGDA
jgi:hypothetical protein